MEHLFEEGKSTNFVSFFTLQTVPPLIHVSWAVVTLIKMTGSAVDFLYVLLLLCGKHRVSNKVLKALLQGRPDQASRESSNRYL